MGAAPDTTPNQRRAPDPRAIIVPGWFMAMLGAVTAVAAVVWTLATNYSQHLADVRETKRDVRIIAAMLCGDPAMRQRNQATCVDLVGPAGQPSQASVVRILQVARQR